MQYIDAFRDNRLAEKVAQQIGTEANPDKHYKLMEFCGGHTHALHRYGIPSLLPNNVEMVHGPGCPVCVLPMRRIDNAIALAKMPGNILCSYGDMLRVPGAEQESLLKAKANGADVRMVYCVDDALKIATENPDKKVIFFAIGFETTTPPTAVALVKAKQQQLTNFYVFCNHVLTPVAMETILDAKKPDGSSAVDIDGFIGPAHVSIIIGSDAYKRIAEKYQKPIVISGFEPLDMMQSILMLIRLINQHSSGIENEYIRAVSTQGNKISQQYMADVFELRDAFEWRGLGDIADSALKIKAEYQDFDAEKHFELPISNAKETKGCECGNILRGIKKPNDCKLFATVCTPENPLGSCMVSSEGACAAYYAYGRLGVSTT